ncbi:hypothetical protein ES705_46674 [subsurface metagenome]
MILVKKINKNENIRITLRKFVSEVRKSVLKFEVLVIGEIRNPDMIKIPKIINNIIVK